MGDHEVCITRRKKREEEEGGSARGGRGKGLAPNRYSSCIHGDTVGMDRGNAAVWNSEIAQSASVVNLTSSPISFRLAPGRPALQFGTVAPQERGGGCWLAAPFTTPATK